MTESRATILSLPPEVFEDIFGYLRSGRDVSFRSLSLVARAFAIPAQRHLYRTLSMSIDRRGVIDELLTFLRDAPPHIRGAVRHVKLCGAQDKPLDQRPVVTQRSLAALLARLPGVTHLTLRFVEIQYSAADEDDLARIGCGRDGKSLQRLDLYFMPHFHDRPREYVSILSLFHTIGTLHIDFSIGGPRKSYVPSNPAYLTLDYLPVRSLGVQCIKLRTPSNLSWITLLSNTRTALGGVDVEEGPTLRKLRMHSIAAQDARALGELFRRGGKNMEHVDLCLDDLLDPELCNYDEEVATHLSLGTSCPRLETLTVRAHVVMREFWQRMVNIMATIVHSLHPPINTLTLILDARESDLMTQGTLPQEIPHLWPVLTTWAREEYILQARVAVKVRRLGANEGPWGYNAGEVAQAVEEQLAATPIAPYVRRGSLAVEWIPEEPWPNVFR